MEDSQSDRSSAQRFLRTMHIRFGSDEDGEAMQDADPAATSAPPQQPMASAPAYQSSGTPARLRVVNSIKADFAAKDDTYVYDITQAPSGGGIALAASLSNRKVKLFIARETDVAPVGDLVGHSKNINQVAFCSPQTSQELHSCSSDGSVRGWDIRSQQEVERVEVQGRELWSFAVRDNIIAAGANSEVLFFDRRTRKHLESFYDAHAEEVTQVHFHPTQPNVFLSASTDGLISVYDISTGLNEDDGFQACLNTGNSIAQVGFYGQSQEMLWCRTHTEGLHLWDWRSACSEEGAEGSGALLSLEGFREAAGQAATASGVQQLANKVDYMVGCSYDAASDTLWAKAGNNEGALGIFPVVQQSPSVFGIGSPSAVLLNGHTSVVRCLVWPGVGTRCLTAGEDSRICIWDLTPPTSQAAQGHQYAAGPAHKHKKAERRHSPY